MLTRGDAAGTLTGLEGSSVSWARSKLDPVVAGVGTVTGTTEVGVTGGVLVVGVKDALAGVSDVVKSCCGAEVWERPPLAECLVAGTNPVVEVETLPVTSRHS
jgi:hypothetical protein